MSPPCVDPRVLPRALHPAPGLPFPGAAPPHPAERPNGRDCSSPATRDFATATLAIFQSPRREAVGDVGIHAGPGFRPSVTWRPDRIFRRDRSVDRARTASAERPKAFVVCNPDHLWQAQPRPRVERAAACPTCCWAEHAAAATPTSQHPRRPALSELVGPPGAVIRRDAVLLVPHLAPLRACLFRSSAASADRSRRKDASRQPLQPTRFSRAPAESLD